MNSNRYQDTVYRFAEVVSPSSRTMDYFRKLFKYEKAGVKEYWIINAAKRIVSVYVFACEEHEKEGVTEYSFEDTIPCSLYPDLFIRLADYV